MSLAEYVISTSSPVLNWNATGNERIIQNVLNLIRTFRYAVGYDRTRGINPAVVDKPLNEAVMIYTAEIYRVVELYEPRATVKSVSFSGLDDDGNMDFEVAIEI